MKIGFLIKSHEDLDKWATFADGIGVEGIELDFMGSGPYVFEPDKINAALAEKKAKLCAIGLWHINTIDPDPPQRRQNRALIEDFLKTTAATGTPIAFMNTGTYEEGNTDQNMAEFIQEHRYYTAMAADLGIRLGYYLGHKGNFINSREILTRVVEEIPDIWLKLDPVGLMRNSHADPYDILEHFGQRILHFHCKDIYRRDSFEIEPPVGLGDLHWNKMIGLLYHHGYDGYLVIEPHGPLWGTEEKEAGHILLSKRHLEQFLL